MNKLKDEDCKKNISIFKGLDGTYALSLDWKHLPSGAEISSNIFDFDIKVSNKIDQFVNSNKEKLKKHPYYERWETDTRFVVQNSTSIFDHKTGLSIKLNYIEKNDYDYTEEDVTYDNLREIDKLCEMLNKGNKTIEDNK